MKTKTVRLQMRSVSEVRMQNEWRYEDCDLKLDTACAKPFRANESYALGDCVSHVLVGGIPCCIAETIQLGKPSMTVSGLRLRTYIKLPEY